MRSVPNKVKGNDDINGYFSLVSNQSKKTRKRGLLLKDSLPIGLGTLYAWDFAFVQQNGSLSATPVTGTEKNVSHFRYVGQAAQAKTSDRIKDHYKSANSGDDGERKMYHALSEAIKDKAKKAPGFPTNATQITDDENIVRVFDVVSLFDLASMEAKEIDNNNLTQPANTTSFSELVKKKGMVGLNTLAKGVEAVVAGAKSAGEIIAAAFFYLTEDRSDVIASREEYNKNRKANANQLIQDSKGDFRIATKKLFMAFDLDKTYDIGSKGFDILLNRFYKKVGSKDDYKLGIETKSGSEFKDENTINLESKFGNPILKATFQYKDLPDGQTIKGIFFTIVMAKDDVKKIEDANPLMAQASKEANKLYEQNLGAARIAEALVSDYEQKASKMGNKSKSKSSEPPLDRITKDVEQKLIQRLPKNIKVSVKKDIIFSDRALGKEKQQVSSGNFEYINEKDIELMTGLITHFSINYFTILGVLPTYAELSGILGNFVEGKRKSVISRLKKAGYNNSDAVDQADNFIITSEWTRK